MGEQSEAKVQLIQHAQIVAAYTTRPRIPQNEGVLVEARKAGKAQIEAELNKLLQSK